MTAAGAAIATVASQPAEASGNVHTGQIQILFVEGKVSVDSLTSALSQIVHIAGCPGCGMIGFDISFIRGVEVQISSQLPAVQTILVTE
jgi:hypothetical protein